MKTSNIILLSSVIMKEIHVHHQSVNRMLKTLGLSLICQKWQIWTVHPKKIIISQSNVVPNLSDWLKKVLFIHWWSMASNQCCFGPHWLSFIIWSKIYLPSCCSKHGVNASKWWQFSFLGELSQQIRPSAMPFCLTIKLTIAAIALKHRRCCLLFASS